jgi:hypothetical protein
VTLPDPGVPAGTVNFSLTPVEFGAAGNFTAQPFAVPVQNTPYFSKPLAADANNVAGGATVNLSWTVEHGDSGTLTNDFPGSTAVPIANPASGTQAVTVPTVIIPMRLTYTLAVSRQSGKYTSANSVAVETAGSLQPVVWVKGLPCNPSWYLPLDLYQRFPNKRITQIGVWGQGWAGICGIMLWYSDNTRADYTLGANLQDEINPTRLTFALQAGEYLNGVTCMFTNGWGGGGNLVPAVAPLFGLIVKTSSGRTQSMEMTPNKADVVLPPLSMILPAGQQIIGFGGGQVQRDSMIGVLGTYTCPIDYGA